MDWTATTRAKSAKRDRRGLRYASDCTDDGWALVAPFFSDTSKIGRRCTHSTRTLWEAVQYIRATGCQWWALPRDFPPFTTVKYHFYGWRGSGLIGLVNDALVLANRLIEGRAEAPPAGIIESQSVRTTESRGPRGFDAGKKINGRKLHIATDTLGNVLEAEVHEASIQDRDGVPRLIESVKQIYPSLVNSLLMVATPEINWPRPQPMSGI